MKNEKKKSNGLDMFGCFPHNTSVTVIWIVYDAIEGGEEYKIMEITLLIEIIYVVIGSFLEPVRVHLLCPSANLWIFPRQLPNTSNAFSFQHRRIDFWIS